MDYWYRIKANLPSSKILKSHEFSIEVQRAYVETLVGKVKPKKFKERFDENVEVFCKYLGNAKFRGDLHDEEFPWLWGFDLGRSGIRLNRDFDNQEGIRVYSTHNCDTLEQRGLFIKNFFFFFKKKKKN